MSVIDESNPRAMIGDAGEILSDYFSDVLNVLFGNRVESREVLDAHCSDKKIYLLKISLANMKTRHNRAIST